MVRETILSSLISKWGLEKFLKVIAVGIIGGSLSMLIVKPLLPNEPENNQKGE